MQCSALLAGFDGPVFIAANKMSGGVRARVDWELFERELSVAAGLVEISDDREAGESLPRFGWARQPPADWAIQVRELAALITASWMVRR
jgi:NAD/NADP transhydrogenase alpha subunit